MLKDDKKTLRHLESSIDQALLNLESLQQKHKTLLKEKKELLSIIAEKDLSIKALQRLVEEIKAKSNDNAISYYKKNEEKLRSRIQTMLSKLDELKVAD